MKEFNKAKKQHRKRRLYWIALSMIGISLCLEAAPSYPHLYRPLGIGTAFKAYELELRGTYFETLSYFDHLGTEQDLREGSSFVRQDVDFFFRYGQSPRLKWDMNWRLRQNISQSEQENQSIQSGLESYALEGLYLFKRTKTYALALGFGGRRTFYDNDEIEEGENILGDSGLELSLGLKSSYQWSPRNTLDFSLTYRQPPNPLSEEIPYSLRNTWVGPRLALFLGVEGLLSLQTGGTPSVVRPRGETYLYNSLNREILTPHVGFYYAFSRWRIGLKAGHVISGVSTDRGNQVEINLLWGNQGVSQSEQKIQRFKEYHIEATVTKVSPRGTFIQINKGFSDDIDKGMKLDIYKTDFFGGNELVAEGVVQESGVKKAIIKLTKKIKNIRVEKGFIVRGQ